MFEGKKVLVTGATGMIGTQLVPMLKARRASVRITIHKRTPQFAIDDIEIIRADLMNLEDCRTACKGVDFIFNMAAEKAGVLTNSLKPASMFTPNVIMPINMLEAARLEDVDRYLYTSSICVYGDSDLFEEDRVWDELPERSNYGYGWAKRVGELQCQLYAEQYGMKISIVRPSNAYGPYDDFDGGSAHVVPSLINRLFTEGVPLKVWGDGESSRDLIYSKEVAKGMILALEKYATADPVNLASGTSIKIKELARLICLVGGYKKAELIFDHNMPKGQRNRVVSTKKAEERLGFRAETTLEEGLKETIAWYQKFMAR